jgi:pyrroline-5-carboxylate reductase
MIAKELVPMPLQLDGTLLLAGAGNMGHALLAGWLAGGLEPGRIVVQDPAPQPHIRQELEARGVPLHAQVPALPEPPAVLLLAVKPQVMDEVLPQLARLAGGSTVVMSIAAGRSIASLEAHLAKATAVVRAMPNTPASVGRSITVAVGNANVTPVQRAACDRLLCAVGDVAWVDDEALIDAVTAVSGSGPAYVFYLAECLAEAGVAAGLALPLARQLARATVAGAGELLHRSVLDATALRRNVTSPGGTTAAALEVLAAESGGLPELMRNAVAAAARRSRELAK